MGTWPQAPDLTDSGVPYQPEDWEDWLRWDPTVESHSPDDSSKDSNESPTQALNNRGDQFPWIGNDETLAPPLIVGDDSGTFDFSGALDQSSFDFANLQQGNDPFVFGNDTSLRPVADQLYATPNNKDTTFWPAYADLGQQQHGLSATLMSNAARNSIGSSSGVDSTQHLSPENASHTQSTKSSSMSPGPQQPVKKKPGRKRKSSSGDEKSGTSGSPGDGEPPVKKTSHNVIEKRYRNNLNDKILELRDSVPSLRAMHKGSGEGTGSEDLDGLAPAHKLNKSTVMAKATEYIKHLEKRNKTISDEMDEMKSRLALLEKAFARSSAAQDRQINASANHMMARPRQPSMQTQPVTSAAQVPEQYMQQHASPTYEPLTEAPIVQQQGQHVNGNGGNGFMGKLMVGSLAGLMLMEGFHEQDQNSQSTSGRGLFALPTQIIKRGDMSMGPSQGFLSQATFASLKMFILFGALLYLVLPLLSRKPPRKAQAPPPQVRLTGAPSLAAPVEMRRKAWLTAIQSVWTPRHFLLEVVAVGLRMMELSLRRIVGMDAYSKISGITKEAEAARIKAWDIAVDAQLAGGDAEVSYYRLLLTLMASGTIPDSPIRLMQKAVHFRIFFWEVANAGYGNLFMFKDFTARVGKIYWESARAQQKALASGNVSNDDDHDHIDLLPDHLAALIELDCDSVLTDEMIQRAYNLAWNRPSAENTTPNPILDSVVEDYAIRSPLDAVAAWFTNTTIDEALATSLTTTEDADTDVAYLVDLSASTAPPASATQTRAYVTRAVLMDDHREANVAAALATIPAAPSSSQDKSTNSTLLMNGVDHIPVSPDIRTALTLAKLLSLSSSTNPASARVHAASVLASLPITSTNLTLLTAVSTHKVIGTFASDALLFSFGKTGLESLSGSLRRWIGSRASKSAGLNRPEKGRIVERCLSVAKKLGGWKSEDVDSGYGSAGRSRRESEEKAMSAA